MVEPNIIYKESFLRFVVEVKESGYETYEQYAKAEYNFEEFIEDLIASSKGINIEEDWAPFTTYWLVSNLELIGVIRIRHHINSKELKLAGHIGYEIVSSERRKGYGTKILALGLHKASELGLEEVIITCDADNIGSKAVIKKFESNYIGTSVDDETGKDVNQYKVRTLKK